MHFPVIHIFVLLSLLYQSEAYRAQKASQLALNRIKRLINQQIQVQTANDPLLQSDAIVFQRKDIHSKRHPDELSVNDPEKYFQGDVDLSEKQAQIISEELQNINNDVDGLSEGGAKTRKKRKIGREPIYVRWDRTKPISYDFDKSIPYSTRLKIKSAISLWEQNTCIRFQENGPNVDRLEFFDGGGCSSFVGKTGGTQGISISTPGCDNVGIIAHEVGHSLGTFHEQARPDQTSYIYVNYHNIPISRWNNFQPVSFAQADTFDLPYDAGSVMHYGPYGFATDPYVATITTKDQSLQSTIGQREGPSFLDFQAINKAYRCTDHCPPLACTHGGYPNPNNCYQCLCPDGFAGGMCELLQYTSCGSIIKASTEPVSISSPNYPQYFPQNSQCIWLLKAPRGGKVFFQFEDQFEMSCEDTCDSAYVELKVNDDFRMTGYRFCCPRVPKTAFESATDEIIVIFRSKSYSSRGFTAKVWSNKSAPALITPKETSKPYSKTTVLPPAVKTTTLATTTTTRAPIFPEWLMSTTTYRLILTTPSPPTTLRSTLPFWLTTPRMPPSPTIKPYTFAPYTNVFTTTQPSVTDKPIDCVCGDWSEWTSSCTQQCGGCGKRSRRRLCNAKDCRNEEKRACNFRVCPPGTNFLINNGEFHILWKGCCVGLFRSGTECSSLEDEQNPFLTIIASLFTSHDERSNRTFVDRPVNRRRFWIL